MHTWAINVVVVVVVDIILTWKAVTLMLICLYPTEYLHMGLTKNTVAVQWWCIRCHGILFAHQWTRLYYVTYKSKNIKQCENTVQSWMCAEQVKTRKTITDWCAVTGVFMLHLCCAILMLDFKCSLSNKKNRTICFIILFLLLSLLLCLSLCLSLFSFCLSWTMSSCQTSFGLWKRK